MVASVILVGSLLAAILATRPNNDPGRKEFVATVIRYCEEVWILADQTLQTSKHTRCRSDRVLLV